MQQQQKVVKVNGEMVNDGVVGCEEAHEGEGRDTSLYFLSLLLLRWTSSSNSSMRMHTAFLCC
jgi:hypothetical protein